MGHKFNITLKIPIIFHLIMRLTVVIEIQVEVSVGSVFVMVLTDVILNKYLNGTFEYIHKHNTLCISLLPNYLLVIELYI